jgi:hypothetical protein
MTPRTVLSLAVVTVLVAIAAVVVALGRQGPAPVRYVDQPAFPELRANPDAVAGLTIQTATGTVTLTRAGSDQWQAKDRYGYPAAADKIRGLVVQLADMRLIEAKTDRAERYARLEVEDLGEGAKSRLVKLTTADGGTLAEAIFGKRRYRLTGTEQAGTYLRRVGESQSWLASGGPELQPEVKDWLDQEIVDIGRDEVQRVELTPAEGAPYVVSRTAIKAEPVLEGLAPDEKLSQDANLGQLFSALTAVRLADVKPRAELQLPAQRQTAKVRTFDGLEVTLQLALIDDQPWAVVDAAANPPADAGAKAVIAKEQATAIGERTGSWAYQVNQSLYQRLTKPRDSWLAAPDGTS